MKKYWYLFFVPVFMGLTACHDDKEEPEQREQRESYLSCPDDHHPHLINLDLPSGTLWACCNVGATAPENYGSYFAWGETEVKSVYEWRNYIHSDGTSETCHDLGASICGTEYDVATKKWGSSWQMPSLVQIQELLAKCSYEWTELNGIKGMKFKGSNGGSIFLPAAGGHELSHLGLLGQSGRYWSGTQNPLYNENACYLYFYNNFASWIHINRYCGYSVRPVAK